MRNVSRAISRPVPRLYMWTRARVTSEQGYRLSSCKTLLTNSGYPHRVLANCIKWSRRIFPLSALAAFPSGTWGFICSNFPMSSRFPSKQIVLHFFSGWLSGIVKSVCSTVTLWYPCLQVRFLSGTNWTGFEAIARASSMLCSFSAEALCTVGTDNMYN